MSKRPEPFRFNKATADKQLANDLGFAEERLRTHGQVSMLLIFRAGHDPNIMHLLPSGWGSADEREMTIKVFRTLGIGLNARMVSFMSEAWMRKVPKRDDESEAEHKDRAYGVRPSRAEDRIEVLMASVAYRDEGGRTHQRASIREILRDASGACIGLRPVDSGPEDGEAITESWLKNVIPPVSVGPADREKAMDLLRQIGVTVELQNITSR